MSKTAGANARFLNYLETAVSDSLLDEVRTTPKPGLVDLLDSGAHRDMDVHTFEASAAAITPYLTEMARTGLSFAGKPEALFSSIRPIGVEAERAMFAATLGVNTHKGAIFSMGLMAAAAGAVFARAGRIGAEEVLDYCGRMCHGPLEAEFAEIRATLTSEARGGAHPEGPPFAEARGSAHPEGPFSAETRGNRTHGELLYLRYGARGVRGEAADGFPHVRDCSLPVLRKLSGQAPPPGGVLASAWPGAGPTRAATETVPTAAQAVQMAQTAQATAADGASALPWNRICLQTLLHLMAAVDDTNVLHRTGPETLGYVREQAARILDAGGSFSEQGMEQLRLLNLDFIEKNISPGGCADLLAITLFIRRLELYRNEAVACV